MTVKSKRPDACLTLAVCHEADEAVLWTHQREVTERGH